MTFFIIFRRTIGSHKLRNTLYNPQKTVSNATESRMKLPRHERETQRHPIRFQRKCTAVARRIAPRTFSSPRDWDFLNFPGEPNGEGETESRYSLESRGKKPIEPIEASPWPINHRSRSGYARHSSRKTQNVAIICAALKRRKRVGLQFLLFTDGAKYLGRGATPFPPGLPLRNPRAIVI